MALLPRMIGGNHVLAAVFQPFDRTPEPHRREKNKNVFRIDLAAYAETAADMVLVQMDARGTASQHAREYLAIPVGNLGGPMQFEHVARGIVAADRAARLQWHAGMAPDGEIQFNYCCRALERRGDVAVTLTTNGWLRAQA